MRLKPYLLLAMADSAQQKAIVTHLKAKFGESHFVMHFSEPIMALNFFEKRRSFARVGLIITSVEAPFGTGLIRKMENMFPGVKSLLHGNRSQIRELMSSFTQKVDGFLVEGELDPGSHLIPTVEELLKSSTMDENLQWTKLLALKQKEKPAEQPDIKIIRATTQEELTTCFKLRYEVWHREFNTIPSNYFSYEYDAYDPLSIHILALVDGKAVGTVRMIPCQMGSPVKLPCEDLFTLDPYRANNIGEIGRLVIRRKFRNGLTSKLMIKALLACSAAEGYIRFYGSANPRYRIFYERMGMKVLQDDVLEYENFGGLPAIPMKLCLDELSLKEMRDWGRPAAGISLKPNENPEYELA